MCLTKMPKINPGKQATPAAAPPPAEKSAMDFQTEPENSYGRLNQRHKARTNLRIDRKTPAQSLRI